MIDVRAYTGGQVRAGVDPADISDLVGTPGTFLWVDVAGGDDRDLDCVGSEFSLHALEIEDAKKHGQRTKLELYPNHGFVVAYSADLAEVDVFVGEGWVVTVRGDGQSGAPWDPSAARLRFERTAEAHVTSGFLLYVLLDEIVDGYFVRTDATEDVLESIEDRIFGDEVIDERMMQSELYGLRRDLVAFRRRIVPLRDVVARLLRREVPAIDDVALTHLQDVFDHILRVVDVVDSQRELMGNAVDAHLALISNRMNRVMKRMTSWGAIVLGSTLIAGIYGMNFEVMPELRWQFGYPFALSLMATLTAALYVYFKRRDWL